MNWQIPQIRYAGYERCVMRVLFALVVAAHIPGSLAGITLSAPNGLARLLDFHFLLAPATLVISRDLLWLALALYVLRVGWSFALPYMTALSIALGTVLNSQGAINHSFQIVSLVLLAQTAAHFYSKWRQLDRPEDRVISWSQQAIVATYLVSGLTKLIHTSGRWFFESPLIAVQIVKATDQDYYDHLDRAARDSGLPIAQWIAAHPWPVALVLGCGLLLELTSPLALLGRRFALAYGLSLLLFHETVYRVMKLGFAENQYLLWIYLVNVPFWAFTIAVWFRRSRSAQEFFARS